MYDLKACTVCFSTDNKLYNMDKGQLRHEFQVISDLQITKDSGLPNYLCFQCVGCLRSCIKFRDKIHRALYALQEILQKDKEITASNLTNFNRSLLGIMSPLSYMSLDKTHLDHDQFQWTHHNRASHHNAVRPKCIPVFHCSTLTSNETLNTVTNLENEVQETESNIVTEPENETDYTNNNLGKDEYLAETSLNADMDNLFKDNNDSFTSDNEPEDSTAANAVSKPVVKVESTADESNLDKEYAIMIPITIKEANAAVQVYKMYSQGRFRCETCNEAYSNENSLRQHMKMHDTHVGNYYCGLCNYYYKTEFLLKTHMTEKHKYKYVCRKCPEVNFDRTSAKKHFILVHLQESSKKHINWYKTRPSDLSTKGGKQLKIEVSLKPLRKLKKVPEDFLVYSPMRHEEQYALVQERQNSKNYKEAKFKCGLCYRGFQELVTYSKHMKKHSPTHSGPLQCDMCKLHFKNQRKLYNHMRITHLFKWSCQVCSYVCNDRGQAQMHYRWHKNVTYSCPHCQMEFTKASTRLTHIRIKHPSMNLCNLCGHSFVSESGLNAHKQIAHTKEEIELSSQVVINKSDSAYCEDCNIQFVNEAAFDTHLGSSYKHATTNVSIKVRRRLMKTVVGGKPRGRPRRNARKVRNTVLLNDGDVQARKAEHPNTGSLMCDVCGHIAKHNRNLIYHMRTHTKEKPYECPHCDKTFNIESNRDRHLVVSYLEVIIRPPN